MEVTLKIGTLVGLPYDATCTMVHSIAFPNPPMI
jgi:hypothetical protein